MACGKAVPKPRSPAQLPLHYDYHPSGRRYDYYDLPFTPQFRFGYGLSYTRFAYSDLRIEPRSGDPGFVTITANVRNVGSVDGDGVAQLYLSDLVSSVSTSVIELQGFTRVSLKRGETKAVRFELTPYQLSLLDADMIRRVEPGVFRVHVGGVSPEAPANSADDRKAKVGFRDSSEGISGQFTEPTPYSAQFFYSLDAPEKVSSGKRFSATVTATNKGNLTDVTEVKLYSGEQVGSWRFELRPGETKSHSFETAVGHPGKLVVVGGSKAITKSLILE